MTYTNSSSCPCAWESPTLQRAPRSPPRLVRFQQTQHQAGSLQHACLVHVCDFRSVFLFLPLFLLVSSIFSFVSSVTFSVSASCLWTRVDMAISSVAPRGSWLGVWPTVGQPVPVTSIGSLRPPGLDHPGALSCPASPSLVPGNPFVDIVSGHVIRKLDLPKGSEALFRLTWGPGGRPQQPQDPGWKLLEASRPWTQTLARLSLPSESQRITS